MPDDTERLNKEGVYVEEAYRLLAENITDLVIHHGPDGSMLYISPSAQTLTGYSPDEVWGLPMFDFFHPDDVAGAVEAFTAALKSPGPTYVEYRIRHQAGHYLWLGTTCKPFVTSSRETYGIIATSRDVTTAKEMEAALKKAYEEMEERVRERTAELSRANEELHQQMDECRLMEARLRESAEKFQTVANYIYDWEYWIGPELEIIFVSPSCQSISGYSPAEFIENPSLIDSLVHPNDKEVYDLHMRQYRGGLRFTEQVGEFEFRIIDKSGQLHWIAHRCRPVFSKAGQFLGRRVSNRDITVQKLAQEDKKIIEEQLRQSQKLEAIGTLAGGIAHDFNNILAAIFGYAELALMESKPDSNIKSYLEQLLEAGQRGRDLVRQILNFSRRTEGELIPLEINPIIKEANKLIRAVLPATIEIILDIDPQPLTVQSNPTQIHQILMNLCSNAAHAMKLHGGVLEISLSTIDSHQVSPTGMAGFPPGAYCRLQVRDTGEGMDRETMNRIFEPFFTTKGPGEGTGMGLAVVYGIVKNHGGTVEVSSEPGKGTTFTIYLPLLENSVSTEQLLPRSNIPVGHECILFVDDEKPLTAIAGNALNIFGYQVEISNSSLEALVKFRADPNKYDLLITDLTMPQMTGVELAGEVRKICPYLPIILCTGFSQAVSPEEVSEAGIERVLPKPLNFKEMAEAIRAVLDKNKK